MATLTGIDIGFNAVKALGTNGRRAHFPSEVGTPLDEGGYSMQRGERMVVTMPDGRSWPVGETALKQSTYHSGRRDADWVLSESWEALFCAALSELHKGTTKTNLVTGLPLQSYDAYADRLREKLVGDHRFRREEGNWQTVTVEKATVITQPYGSLLDQAMTDGGRLLSGPFTEGTVAIADIGGNTLNLLVTDVLEEIGRWTEGAELGLLDALDQIARAIHAQCPGISPTAREVSAWLPRGSFPYGEWEEDMAPYAVRYLVPLVDMLINRLSEAWPEPGRFRAVLLTGGGAMAVGEALKRRMDGVYPNVTVAPDAHFANVRGYLKLARRLWG